MKWCKTLLILTSSVLACSFMLQHPRDYESRYFSHTVTLEQHVQGLLNALPQTNFQDSAQRIAFQHQLHECRKTLKRLDFWYRYLEPVVYRKINGPLPVEWETEVFEKFEPPYRREGGGLSLAEIALLEEQPDSPLIRKYLTDALGALRTFSADSLTAALGQYDHFYYANRLFLANLASIYTTGFDCPDTSRVVPELVEMLSGVREIYADYNRTFPAQPLPGNYLALFDQAIREAGQHPVFSHFDHYQFIRKYVNPLFALNQQLIRAYRPVTRSFNDYSFNNEAQSLFDKDLYRAQEAKGVYAMVEDQEVLREIYDVGKLLFYDPVVSGNNKRSCASCHNPGNYFNDGLPASYQYNQADRLHRNTPSLLNVVFNHLMMADGKHIAPLEQAGGVVSNPIELNSHPGEVLDKVMSCRHYREAFRKLLKYTPEEKKVTIEHVYSAVTYYYSQFSQYAAPFDHAMNQKQELMPSAIQGFNLFMGKAKCGTCHFVPLFNGVKPPYTGSEFEVIGVPADTMFSRLSADSGRYGVHASSETLHAFRTGTIRNIFRTAPYMHNGIFNSLDAVLDFYNQGGGLGKGLPVGNQTLPADPLQLTSQELQSLKDFMRTLEEEVPRELPPASLPWSELKKLNLRKVGGEY